MLFGAVGLAFNIFTRWVHTSPFFLLSIGHVHRLAELQIVPKQLFERLQEPQTERTEPFHPAAVPASIPDDGASADLLVIPPKCRRFRNRLLRIAGAVLVRLGSDVCASSRKDHPCARHQDRFPFAGPYMDMERNWCPGC